MAEGGLTGVPKCPRGRMSREPHKLVNTVLRMGFIKISIVVAKIFDFQICPTRWP